MGLYARFRDRVTTTVSHPEDRRFWRFVIHDRDSKEPYLVRWSLKLIGGYVLRLHVILRPDGTPCTHDHPWPFWTFCLLGGYLEEIEEDTVIHAGGTRKVKTQRKVHRVRPLTVHARPASFRHTITALPRGRAITLVLTGPKVKSWGFYTKWGFKGWRDFLGHNGAVRALWCRD